MWGGIEFHGKADNCYAYGTAEFEITGRNAGFYRVRFLATGTGMAIDKREKGKWTELKDQAEVKDLEAVLPTRSDFAHDWTYRDFMIALTFYNDGRRHGHAAGEWDANERRNRLQRNQEANNEN